MDLGLADLINGFCGAVATYLAFQMKTILSNHDKRITALEAAREARQARRRKPRR